MSKDVVASETAGFDSYAGFSDAEFAAVNRGNVETLFPRFAA